MNLRAPLIAIAVILGACAYTGGGETGTGATGSEITTTGVITGFGSIFVGGVEYFTDGATILVDGQPLSENQLAVGMVVTLKGTLNPDGTTGEAREVAYRKNLIGPVQANTIPPAGDTGTLTVLGQTIEVDPYTVFEGDSQTPTPDQLTTDQVVEISGFTTPTGLYAARIELQGDSTSEYELRGRVTNFTDTTFTIGRLTIAYQNATVEGTLEEDAPVKVQGTLDGTTLSATEIEVEEALPGELLPEPERGVELEGLIVIAADGTVTLNGQTITVPAELRSQLQNGDRVELNGRFDAQGRLQVESMEIRPRHNETAELRAPVESVAPDAGTLTIQDVPYLITPTTLMEDVPGFSLANLMGSWVELRVYAQDGRWYITRIQREDAGEWQVTGIVELIDGTPHVAGQPITTTSPLDAGTRVECNTQDLSSWTCQTDDSGEKPQNEGGEGQNDDESFPGETNGDDGEAPPVDTSEDEGEAPPAAGQDASDPASPESDPPASHDDPDEAGP